MNDFRWAAAEASNRVLETSRLVNVLDSPASLCLRIDGAGSAPLYRIALVPWIFALFALSIVFAGIIVGILILTPLMEASLWSVGGAVAAFIVGIILLVMGVSVGDGVFDAVMERNLGSRLGDLRKRVENSYSFCIEDTATYQRLKVISEDYATGGFDRRTPGLLLEGIRYRYVIRPGDVAEFRAHGDHRIVTVTIGSSSLSVALNIAMGDDEKEREAYALLDKIFKPVE